MKESGIQPTIRIFEYLIKIAAKKEDIEGVIHFLRELKASKLKMNGYIEAYICLLHVCLIKENKLSTTAIEHCI